MLSAIVVFAVAFAAMGLLLGFAATCIVEPEREPQFRAGNSMNSISVTIQESVSVTVERSDSG
jgi:hypothetical protein